MQRRVAGAAGKRLPLRHGLSYRRGSTPFRQLAPYSSAGEGPVAARAKVSPRPSPAPWIPRDTTARGVARQILSNETLEGGSMIPVLEASEAYWRVRNGEKRKHDALLCGPDVGTRDLKQHSTVSHD